MSENLPALIYQNEFSISEIPDLTDKVALVTGANSFNGIGFHTAFQLAVKGAIVYISARSDAKAQEAIEEMRRKDVSIKTEQLRPFVVDISDLTALKAAAERLIRDTERLDILVNNAAVLPQQSAFDSHGISMSFNTMTSHLGPFVLTPTLLPLLKKTADVNPGVRIVSVGSEVHKIVPTGIRFDSLASFNTEIKMPTDVETMLARYGLSKLATVLFAKQLQKILDPEGIHAVSVSLHPGKVATGGAITFVKDTAPCLLKELEQALSPLDGAVTSLFAATSPRVWLEKDKYGGGYLVPFGKLENPSEDGQNNKLAEDLWVTSEQVVSAVVQE